MNQAVDPELLGQRSLYRKPSAREAANSILIRIGDANQAASVSYFRDKYGDGFCLEIEKVLVATEKGKAAAGRLFKHASSKGANKPRR